MHYLTLYPIYGLAEELDGEAFDLNQLPFTLMDNVTIEDVSPLFHDETWKWLERSMGGYAKRDLESVHYAIVHRYDADSLDEATVHSERLVRLLATLMRLVRPMRQIALLMRGPLRRDGTLDVTHLEHPINLLEIPELHKLFRLRLADAVLIRDLASVFLKAVDSQNNFWKFRMSAEFYERGFFLYQEYWKAGYILWCSALESIYTSNGSEHRGSLVAKERIKWFLNGPTNIYEPGDVSSFLPQANIPISDVVDGIYKVRNFIAHGDRIPDEFFQKTLRRGLNEELNCIAVYLEAISFIIRNTLLKILRDGLLNHFREAKDAEAFFSTQGLTKSQIKKRLKQSASVAP